MQNTRVRSEEVLDHQALLHELLSVDGIWYMASPYRGFKGTLYEANRMACKTAGYLIKHNVTVHSPIAHSHAICEHNRRIDPTDNNFWLLHNRRYMAVSYGCIVVTAPGWKTSEGVQDEIHYFTLAKKPVLYVEQILEVL